LNLFIQSQKTSTQRAITKIDKYTELQQHACYLNTNQNQLWKIQNYTKQRQPSEPAKNTLKSASLGVLPSRMQLVYKSQRRIQVCVNYEQNCNLQLFKSRSDTTLTKWIQRAVEIIEWSMSRLCIVIKWTIISGVDLVKC